jgi:hypothetical protein
METALAWLRARLHDLALPKQQNMLSVKVHTVVQRLVQSVTLEKGSVWAIARAEAIRHKHDTAITQADCHDLVGIATAFSTDAEVQWNVFVTMWQIAYYGTDEGARKLIAAGAHRVVVAALHAFSTDGTLLYRACWALWHIAHKGGADGIAAIRAFDGTLIDTLRQASDVIRAAGGDDWVSGALVQFCGAAQTVE